MVSIKLIHMLLIPPFWVLCRIEIINISSIIHQIQRDIQKFCMHFLSLVRWSHSKCIHIKPRWLFRLLWYKDSVIAQKTLQGPKGFFRAQKLFNPFSVGGQIGSTLSDCCFSSNYSLAGSKFLDISFTPISYTLSDATNYIKKKHSSIFVFGRTKKIGSCILVF